MIWRADELNLTKGQDMRKKVNPDENWLKVEITADKSGVKGDETEGKSGERR